jgi:ParB-like chromosome segregation protein Spo0J
MADEAGVVSSAQAINRLEVTYLPLEALKPSRRNARTHSKDQVRQIADSISQYGWTNPILCDEAMEIIAGHGRLMAARHLEMSEVPVVILTGLSEGQKRALRIADNKIALNSGWNTELLKVELGEIVADWPELQLGWETGEIDSLLAAPPDPDDESVPAAPDMPVSQPGDVWLLGKHKVACGDCQDPQLMAALMGSEKADAAFLDPPYNQPARNIGNSGKVKHRDIAGAYGQLSSPEFVNFLKSTRTSLPSSWVSTAEIGPTFGTRPASTPSAAAARRTSPYTRP